MYEQQMIKYMRNMGVQLQNLQALVKSLEMAVQNIRVNGNVVSRIEVVGVKDISSAQLYDAYKKGLNMEQLVQLADGKYTAEQIYKKLQKYGGCI